MTRIGRIVPLGKALALSAACGLAGCQQLRVNTATPTPAAWNRNQDEGKVTPAQQADVQIALGHVAERQGDLAGAISAYNDALKRDGRRADAYARLAILHDQQGEFRESANLYRQALKLSPGNPDVYCDMGYSLYLQRRWAEADMNLRQALALNSKHQRAHNNLALLLARTGRIDEAVAEFRKAGSDPSAAHASVALVLSMEERWDEARQQYNLALAAKPDSTELKTRIQQLESTAAKLTPRREYARATQDTRLVTTSNTFQKPPSPPPATMAVSRDLPAPISTPVHSVPQQQSTPSPSVIAMQTPRAAPTANGVQRNVPIPSPKKFQAQESVSSGDSGRRGAPIPPPKVFQATSSLTTP